MRMRTTRILSVLLRVWILLLASVPAIAAPEDYDKNAPQTLQEDYLYGEAAVAIDADTGDVLFSKNSRVRMYPASTTKIMTLLLAVESGWSFDTPVTIPPEAGDIPSDSSIVPVYSGETTTFGELLYGMMLHSGNDAANAVAVLVLRGHAFRQSARLPRREPLFYSPRSGAYYARSAQARIDSRNRLDEVLHHQRLSARRNPAEQYQCPSQ